MADLAIKAEGLGKRYTIGRRGSVGRRWLNALATARARQLGVRSRNVAGGEETIWALRDVSFEIRCGEVVGVVGRNGAGKSTLLKVLSGITRPDTGVAEINGRLGSLLEVGTGFHPDLTGRENVFLNGAILGMHRAEVDRKFDDIIEFAGIERFVDTPVKHYSSGMYVRLAFAVAAHLDPEILLVDEVLAVGDAAFQRRCLERIHDVGKEGRTVLVVSHNMAVVNQICPRALWIDQGAIRDDGPTEEIVARYLVAGADPGGQRVWVGGVADPGVTEFRLLAVRVMNSRNEVTSTLDARKPFAIEIEYEVLAPLASAWVGLRLDTVDGVAVVVAHDADDYALRGARQPGRFTSRCAIPGHLLNAGRFVISSVSAGVTGVKRLVVQQNVLTFDIEDLGIASPMIGGKRKGVILPQFQWRIEAEDRSDQALTT